MFDKIGPSGTLFVLMPALLNWVIRLLFLAWAVWMGTRAVRALESIAESLRERRQ